ncbi:MAG: alpha/beta fold hydrolase [Mycobacterium sp.]
MTIRKRITPAATPEWAATDWNRYARTVRVRGGDVHYVDIGAGPVVVLIHGLGMSWRMWLPNIYVLARKHRVIAIDLPGFGASQRLPWRRDLGGHAEVVVELLREINGLPATVVGHSLGAFVAQHVAVLLDTDIDGLLLVSSPESRMGMLRRLAIVCTLSLLRTLLYPRWLENRCIKHMRLRKALFGRLVYDTTCLKVTLLTELSRGYATNGFWRAMHAGLRDPVSLRLGSIRAPTLILAGKNDTLIPPSAAHRLASAIPYAEVLVWNDVGHAPMLERPTEFNELVENFATGSALAAGLGGR